MPVRPRNCLSAFALILLLVAPSIALAWHQPPAGVAGRYVPVERPAEINPFLFYTIKSYDRYYQPRCDGLSRLMDIYNCPDVGGRFERKCAAFAKNHDEWCVKLQPVSRAEPVSVPAWTG